MPLLALSRLISVLALDYYEKELSYLVYGKKVAASII